MSSAPTRRALGPALTPTPSRDIDPDLIRQAAEKTGFTETTPSPPAPPLQPVATAALAPAPVSKPVIAPTAPKAAPSAPSAPEADLVLYRQARKSERDKPFTTRLKAETKAAIYAQVNGRDVPVAQVIEEAIAALLEKQAQGAPR